MHLTDYIVTHNKTHLIFDFDATLVLMHIPWPDFARQMREDVIALDAELWERHSTSGRFTPLMTELVDKHGDSGLQILLQHTPVFEMQYKDLYTKNDALLQEVETFREKYRLYIWSSNSRELLEDVLRQLDMHDWFDAIVGRNDVRHLKPSPEGFALIRDPDIPSERYLLIGDSSKDEGAAKAAGIDFYMHDFFEQGR